jgi:hypothetical protein
MHIHLKLFYSLLNSSNFPYICFGLLIDHVQGVTNYSISHPYVQSIALFNNLVNYKIVSNECAFSWLLGIVIYFNL